MQWTKRKHGAELSRRDTLGFLGIGLGISLASAWGGDENVLAALSAVDSKAKKITFPKDAIVRTVLKDVPPQDLATGGTLFHEHLSSHPAPPASPNAQSSQARPPYQYDVDSIIEDVNVAQKAGVSCIVDGGHPDMDRYLEDLQLIAAHTNVHIVASGGYFMQRTYPPNIATESEERIADNLELEARLNRLGAFGEIGAQFNGIDDLTPDEKKVLRAVGKVTIQTGLPLFTHNPYGTSPNAPREAGLKQLDVLEAVGVDPKRIAIGHVCCLDDPTADIAKQLAKRGVFVGFDRAANALTTRFMTDEKRVKMILAFLDAGYQDNLLLSSDFNRAVNRPDDNRGFGGVFTIFVPMLRAAEIKEDVVHSILYDNPRRFLAFVPKRT